MIECEICGNYFHADDINSCPNPNCDYDDLCPECYDNHVTGCMLGDEYTNTDFNNDDCDTDYIPLLDVFQKALSGLYFDKSDFDINPLSILDTARQNERIDVLGDALIDTLSPTQLSNTLSYLEIMFDKEADDWCVC